MKRYILFTLLSFSTVAVWADDIKIGLAGPISGDNAAFGEQLWKGASLAAEAINLAGGVKGNPIQLVQADDACEPKQAVSVANRLVDMDEVEGVIGHFCSSSTIPASNVYAEADILMITPASTNPAVTDRGLSNVLRMCGRDDQQGMVAAHFLAKKLAVKKIAIVHDKDTYGKGLADATVAELGTLGLRPVVYEGLTRGEKDFNALITKIKDKNADALYFGGLHTEAGPLLRQLREQGLNLPFMSGDGIMSEDFVTAAGGPDVVNGVYMTFGKDPRTIPASAPIVEAFRKAGYEPEGYTLYAYAALEAMVAAMNASDTYDGAAYANWLKKHSVETVLGAKTWDKHGDLTVSDYVIYQWQADGHYKELESAT
jgi:branched-chain amino acid transport system substrate-binding protein